MTRIVFANSRGLRLVGTLQNHSVASVVVMVHGFTNDKSSNGRFDKIAQCLNDVGYSTFAFDFSGCGESDDETLTAAKQVDDLRSAVAFVQSEGFANIALWGNSLGGRIALQANPQVTRTMVLTGAATGPIHYRWEDHFSSKQLEELARTGRLTLLREEGPRRKVTVDAQMLEDFAEIDQSELLSGIRCRVLIIHGDGDDEERQLLEISRRGLHFLPAGSRIEVLPGTQHGLKDRTDRVIELGLEWLSNHFVPPEDTTGQKKASAPAP